MCVTVVSGLLCASLFAYFNVYYCFFFFFFKQKTAYEMQRGLVGSEMCIRDRYQRRVHGTKGNNIRVQIPVDCVFGISTLGNILISFRFIVRTSILPNSKIGGEGAIINGTLAKPEMYEFVISGSVVPVAQPGVILNYAGRLSEKIENFPVVEAGIHFKPPFEMKKGGYREGDEEFCFTFTRDQSLSLT
eukprot:TRINITY_DN43144_c0_g1_i2.p2 TRINITY_DN43144_c0_g1~~TRINITY_DN43144_c0_g1_i2.p2  ORF type:complete len:189 (-),score=45.62 TRINITY_DN43144_c0_g1_i2:60-626(-)